jgi:hypothetical protein
MQMHTDKIKKFSRIICIPLQIAFVVLIVAGAFELLVWLLSILHVPTIFEVGKTTVIMLHFITEGISIGSSTFHFRLIEVVGTALTAVIVKMARAIFIKLQVDGSPFRADIVKALKSLAIALLVTGVFMGLNNFIAAGIVWVLCMIFDYGCALQNESDTTL